MTPAMLAALAALGMLKGNPMSQDPEALPPTPLPAAPGAAAELGAQLAQIIAGMASLGAGIYAYMGEMERVRKYREEMERLRLIEIDDRLYEHFVSSCLNGLIAAKAGGAGRFEMGVDIARATEYAAALLQHVRERRSPELRLEMVKAGLSKMSHEEVEALAKEQCPGIRHLLDAVAAEAVHDPRPNSPVGTFNRVLRERDAAAASRREILEALEAEKRKHTP